MGKWGSLGLVALLFSAGQAVAAECPPGTTLQVIGTAQTGSAVVSTGGHKVRASRVACAGTACVAGVYNVDTQAEQTTATVKDEPGAPASTSTWTPYDPPLDFNEGINVHDDGNVNAIILYECR